VEVSALQDWMEGPARIQDVNIANNRWVSCGLTHLPVQAQEGSGVVTLRNNTWS